MNDGRISLIEIKICSSLGLCLGVMLKDMEIQILITQKSMRDGGQGAFSAVSAPPPMRRRASDRRSICHQLSHAKK